MSCKTFEDKIRRQTGVQYTRGTYNAANEMMKLERIREKMAPQHDPLQGSN